MLLFSIDNYFKIFWFWYSIFGGEYFNGKRWDGKGYNKEGKLEFELKYGNGKGKEYDYYGNLS